MANLEHDEDESKHVNMSGETPAACVQLNPAERPLAPERDPAAVPSFAAASELLSAPYSCLVMNTHRRHVVLPPGFLHKKRTGIQGELETELLRFSQSLKGVPLAYDDIRIIGQLGDILDDSSYVHMDIEATFVVFQPNKGQKLLGKVNKLGISHVGCLVHGCFNASIPRPNLVSVETWRDAGPRIGAELEFEVTALDADTVGVLLIRGRMDRTSVQELMAVGESSELSIPEEQPDTTDAEPKPATTEESPDGSPKKKKKKKKEKIKEEEEETESCQQDSITTPELNETVDEVNGNEAEEEEEKKKKKKKKKKEKHLKDEKVVAEEEVELSPVTVRGSDSSGYLSDRQSKKRKRETASDETPGVKEELETPKSTKKKKRKNVIEQFA